MRCSFVFVEVSDMPRYIDADELKRLRDDVISGKLDVKTESDLIDMCPTADVVPRAEFAREIFWELNKIIDEYVQGEISTSEFDDMIAACQKKYTEE
jgi:hypothetical protein